MPQRWNCGFYKFFKDPQSSTAYCKLKPLCGWRTCWLMSVISAVSVEMYLEPLRPSSWCSRCGPEICPWCRLLLYSSVLTFLWSVNADHPGRHYVSLVDCVCLNSSVLHSSSCNGFPKHQWLLLQCVRTIQTVFSSTKVQLICLPYCLLTCLAAFSFHRITESQNSRGWKGPLCVI